MRLELLQRSDSLYGYEVNGAEMIPLLGTCSKEGQLYLRRPDPSTPTADADEQAGSLSPLVHEITGTVQHNCTSFKGVKQVRDQESGAVLDQKAFAAAKRIYTDLPSWMNRGMNAVILLEEAVPDMDKVPDR
ncbi:hypothetical protein KQI65_05240 [bacterium]|nr:hypothetical protein [bacterium]